ncbi:hypothetical protein CMEL01_15267 [Colletotrichum melonis]|uniref:Uncharacterized protein n=1 Tax=Colletotrichum melonis TaxID=1209925 RepID=A0AAI9UQH4_9PEZI|nr:hypothetical protein CMEL01_15267 [Colletotrichum melonis]
MNANTAIIPTSSIDIHEAGARALTLSGFHVARVCRCPPSQYLLDTTYAVWVFPGRAVANLTSLSSHPHKPPTSLDCSAARRAVVAGPCFSLCPSWSLPPFLRWAAYPYASFQEKIRCAHRCFTSTLPYLRYYLDTTLFRLHSVALHHPPNSSAVNLDPRLVHGIVSMIETPTPPNVFEPWQMSARIKCVCPKMSSPPSPASRQAPRELQSFFSARLCLLSTPLRQPKS